MNSVRKTPIRNFEFFDPLAALPWPRVLSLLKIARETTRETTRNGRFRFQNAENEVGDLCAPNCWYLQPRSRWDLYNIASCSLANWTTFRDTIWKVWIRDR